MNIERSKDRYNKFEDLYKTFIDGGKEVEEEKEHAITNRKLVREYWNMYTSNGFGYRNYKLKRRFYKKDAPQWE